MDFNHLLLLHLIQQRHRAFSRKKTKYGEQNVPHEFDLPHENMPRDVITLDNIIFGTAALDIDFGIIPDQLPSLYFMGENGLFVRLRVMHPSGFAVFEADHANVFARVRDQFRVNLGNNASEVRETLIALTDDAWPVGVIEKRNNGVFVWYKDEAAKANHTGGQPLKAFDIQEDPHAYQHKGHSIVEVNSILQYYQENYPGFLDKLMLLGQHAQSYNVQVGNIIQNIPIRTNVEYFQRDEFLSTADQRNAIIALVNSFV